MRYFFFFLLFSVAVQAQHKRETESFEVSQFRGNIYEHSKYIGHLITGHPEGFLISYNRHTYGDKEWQRAYNYPDYGFSFQYQNFKNEYLGKNYAIAAHYNFYFLKRHLVFRISQGIAATTNPFDKHTNYKNNAFGSRLMSSNVFLLNYTKDNIIGGFGIQAGLLFTHFSNGRVKAPNSGINTYAVNFGIHYNVSDKLEYVPVDSLATKNFREPIKYNIAFRTGFSESQITGSGQKPFYHVSVYADKRLGRKSALQLGTELFVSQYLKEFIRYTSISTPDEPYLNPDTDHKRISAFIGHELFVNKLSIEAQVGYYVYKPFKYESDIYQRMALKYYLSEKLFTGISIKAHGARAEAIELGIGVRL